MIIAENPARVQCLAQRLFHSLSYGSPAAPPRVFQKAVLNQALFWRGLLCVIISANPHGLTRKQFGTSRRLRMRLVAIVFVLGALVSALSAFAAEVPRVFNPPDAPADERLHHAVD